MGLTAPQSPRAPAARGAGRARMKSQFAGRGGCGPDVWFCGAVAGPRISFCAVKCGDGAKYYAGWM